MGTPNGSSTESGNATEDGDPEENHVNSHDPIAEAVRTVSLNGRASRLK